MSLSPSSGEVQSKRKEGKTPPPPPPPAPSAFFARRTRELQQNESQPYRPPALRNSPVESEESGLSESQSGAHVSSYRRARAGTLPSNLTAAAQRYAPSTVPTPGSGSPPDTQIPIPNSTQNTMTPAMRQVLASAANSGRGRSGSLTLASPSSGLQNAFGPGILSWQASPLSQQQRGHEITPTISNDSIGNDDRSTGVLDYLGLADSSAPGKRSAYVPATLSELRAQAQQQIQISRSRASTISNPYRNRGPLPVSFMAPGSMRGGEEIEIGGQGLDGENPAAYEALGYPNGLPNGQLPNPLKNSMHLLPGSPANRPRATSVGTLLESPTTRHPPTFAASQYDSPSVSPPQQGLVDPSLDPTIAEYSSFSQTLASAPPQKRPTPAQHHSDIDLSHLHHSIQASNFRPSVHSTTNTPRARTPEDPTYSSRGGPYMAGGDVGMGGGGGGGGGNQVPTRSLWLGNLDPEITTQELMHIFHAYGAIESLRLLPDKECGFVNFVEKNDAIRAMEDVRNRLGGHISQTGGGAPVRVGFGKIDSVPLGPSDSMSNGANAGTASYAGPGGESQTSPTRALWVGSIPSTTTPSKLLSLFVPFGPIESVRVLTHKNCGFVNFERLDSAIVARKNLNGRDILGPEVGAIRIGFARVPVKVATGSADVSPVASAGAGGIGDMSVGASIHALRQIKGVSDVPPDQQVLGGSMEDYRSNLVLDLVGSGVHAEENVSVGGDPASWAASISEQQMIMRILSGDDATTEEDVQSLTNFSPPASYYSTVPVINDRNVHRRFDAAKLREVKKRLDSPLATVADFDDVANDVMEDCVDLSSDHVGNTVIQKIYEKCSPELKLMLLERIAPHLAMIGVHKNGTWAAQKIIDCSTSPEEIAIIAQNLRPYTPPLLLDQFGNYVVSICMRFGAPVNDFIFDAICDRIWEIGQGRFGARSLRTCVESQHTTLQQKKRVATAIVLNSIPLATSPNGALLVTWLVDSSVLPGRFRLLALRFAPHLAHLCTHKLASVAVLRIINQRADLDASRMVLSALFSSTNDQALSEVLLDQIHGVNVIQKILASTALDAAEKAPLVDSTKRVLQALSVSSSSAYRRILEDVGLPYTAPPPNQGLYRQNGRQSSGQYNNGFNSYGLNLPMSYEPSIVNSLAGMSLSGDSWAPPNGLSPLLVQGNGGQFGQFGNGGEYGLVTPTFSPTSDPFNPFASPSSSERQLSGGFRRTSARSSSGQNTPLTSFSAAFDGYQPQQHLDWQRRKNVHADALASGYAQ